MKARAPTLIAASRDPEPLVRAEAVKSAVSFEGLTGAEVIFEVATRPTDPELETVLDYARKQINVDKLVQESLDSGRPLSKAARVYALRNARVDDLSKLERTPAVYDAILSRPRVDAKHLRESLEGLAALRKVDRLDLLLELIEERDAREQPDNLASLGRLLSQYPPEALRSRRRQLEKLATKGRLTPTRRLAYAGWIAADGSGDAAFFTASQSKAALRDLLDAVPAVDKRLRADLYDDVRALMFELPPNLQAEPGGAALAQSGIRVDYFYPSGRDVALETLAGMKPKASGIVPEIVMDVPQRKMSDRFALQFTGAIQIPQSGTYTFFTNSDDGSRLYVGEQLVVNNDGLHGMREMAGSIDLPAGSHPLIVTYFDNGGGDGLVVSWSGPGIPKQRIPAGRLTVGGGETLHDVAVRALVSIPGHEAEKFDDLATLVTSGRQRPAAIRALKTVPAKFCPEKRVRPLVDNLIGYLSGMPASLRTGSAALDAVALAESLADRLPAPDAKALKDRLQNLNVRVIAIGTVPARMIYDKEQIVVQAGKPVEFRFSNTDHMPHNFAIVEPGALEEVGLLAEATARDPDAMERHYIPKSDKILLGSRLLQPGENQALSFEVPSEPGVYPYVCTYPGHWRRMHGELYVVADLAAYRADPEAYLANNSLPLRDELLKYISRNTEWQYDDLLPSVSPLPPGRSFEVGKNIFRVANCVGCHKLNDEGRQLGPDLTKIEPKKHNPEHLLRSLLEPSKEIAEKYQSQTFVLVSGKVLTGMVVEETPTQIKVLVDPLAKGDPLVIERDEIDVQQKSTTSIMPKGLANKLTRAEILDLLAYVYARGDKQHKLFEMHHHD